MLANKIIIGFRNIKSSQVKRRKTSKGQDEK